MAHVQHVGRSGGGSHARRRGGGWGVGGPQATPSTRTCIIHTCAPYYYCRLPCARATRAPPPLPHPPGQHPAGHQARQPGKGGEQQQQQTGRGGGGEAQLAGRVALQPGAGAGRNSWGGPHLLAGSAMLALQCRAAQRRTCVRPACLHCLRGACVHVHASTRPRPRMPVHTVVPPYIPSSPCLPYRKDASSTSSTLRPPRTRAHRLLRSAPRPAGRLPTHPLPPPLVAPAPSPRRAPSWSLRRLRLLLAARPS